MRHLRHFFLLAVLLVAAAAQAQTEEIPFDNAVRKGKLDNGLTYYIRHNEWPEHRANFYIAQKVGSIQEEEAQRGLAHFLEHMCFNGTEHFPGNGVIRFCESIGVKFGVDLNAYTSIDQTVYNIDNVPTTRQSALDSCLLVLSDWAHALTLDPKEIDEERGVIHEEWRLRTSASSRMFERNLPALYPGSKYGVRYPIGLMSVIDNFKPKEIRDYYEKWYHPANQGIIVVGDVDVDYTEAKIKELFGSIKNPDNMAAIVDEQVPDNAEPIVVIDKDKEQRTSGIDLFIKSDAFPDAMKTNPVYILTKYAIQTACSMLNARLNEAAQEPGCPYTAASVGYGNYIFAKTKDAFSLSVEPKEMGQSAEALQAAFTEVLKAAKFGFTATEYERAKADVLAGLEKQYSNKDKRTNSRLYAECREHFLANEPMPGIDWEYQTYKQIVPVLPIDMINGVMKEMAGDETGKNLVLISFNNEADGNQYPTREGLLAAIEGARKADIQAFVDNVKNEPLIATLPQPGTITGEKQNETLGSTELTLSNGVKVVLKHTDFKADEVIMSGNALGGSELYGLDDNVNVKLFDQVIGISGLGNFSSTELQKALAGKNANADLTISQRHTSLDGNATPKDVETMLQMAYLYFTDIAKDQKSYDSFIAQVEVQLKNRALSPEVALSDSLNATAYGHSPFAEPITSENLARLSYDRVLQIAKDRTASANGWTFTIVGNYDEQTIRPLICQYLAALPSGKKAEAGPRTLNWTKGQLENVFKRKQETPKSTAYIIWYNDEMPFSDKNSTALDIAGQVLSMIYLDKIREKESAAYTVGAMANLNADDDKTIGQLLAFCPMKPEKADIAIRIMEEEAANLAQNCPQDLFDKVKEYKLKELETKAKTNGYWRNVLETYRIMGLDMHTAHADVIKNMTPADVSAVVKEFMKAGNRLKVVMLPEE